MRNVFKSRVNAYPGFENAMDSGLKDRKFPFFQTTTSQGTHLAYLSLLDENVNIFAR